jgi:hypothetical protein
VKELLRMKHDYGLDVSLVDNFSIIELTPCGLSTICVPSQRALSVNSEQSSLMSTFFRGKENHEPQLDFTQRIWSLTLARNCGCVVMLRHAVITSMLRSLFSVGGKVAPLHMTMGPSGPAGALNI